MSPPHAAMVLTATILASSLSFVDGTVVNVGLSAIGRGLHGDAAGLQWVINAYLLPLSALLLLGGALGDHYGRRRLLVIGIGLFAVASAACAAAPDIGLLTAARALQGIGAALLMPNSLAVIGESFFGLSRGRAIGTWAAVGAATAGVGPLIGGWLIDVAGWRTIFLVNLPLAVVAIGLAWRYVPVRRSSGQSPLDWVGALLATLGLSLLTASLVTGVGPTGWTTTAGTSLASAFVVLAGFLAWEWRRGARAMVPLGLFGSRSFVGLTLLTFLLYAALGVLFVLLPFAVMRGGGADATHAGAALLPATVILAVLSPLLGGLAEQVGPRPLLASGSAIVALGLLLMLRVDAGSSYWTGLFPAVCVIGLGLAAAVAPLTSAVLASVEASLAGTASGLNTAVARTGGLVATACVGRVLATDGASLVAACHLAAIAATGVSLAAMGCALMVSGARDR